MKKNLTRSAVIAIMKFSIIPALLFSIVLSSYAKDTNGQDILTKKISLKLRSEEIKTVLSEIEKLSGGKFMYSPEIIQSSRKVSIVAKNEEVSAILNRLLQPLGIRYEVVNNYIILSKKNEVISVIYPDIIGSSGTLPKIIRGKVTASTGEVLSGVSVTANNGKFATSTDNNGEFMLNLDDNVQSLLFTHIGYLPSEVTLANKEYLVVVLQPDAQSLEDVVVVGYGTQKKKNIISAISSVKGKDIENLPVATPQSLIQGHASGVQVIQNSGAPGSAVTIRIRGTTSINAGNDPLYIVDGIPVESGTLNSISLSGSQTSALSVIDPNDIESMDVLKDAGALAIYGSRAANGVVIITTKHGKKSATSYNFNFYTGFQNDNKNTRIKLMNSTQAIDLIEEGRANSLTDGVTSLYGFLLPAPDGTISNTNWQDALFRTAALSNYGMSIRGGEDKLKFAISGSYFNQEGIIINSGYKRVTSRVNLDYDASSKLKFGTNISLTKYDNKRVSTEDGATSIIQVALKKSPSLPIYNTDGTFYQGDVSGFINPVAFANKVKYSNGVSSVIGNIYGEYTIFPKLNFRTTFGIDYASILDVYFQPSDAVRNGTASGQTFSSTVDSWINENTLNYSHDFGKHHLTGLLGYSQQKRSSYAISAAGTQYATNNIYTLNAAVLPTSASSNTSAYGLSSAFARLGYSYGDKYYLEAAARRDGSSRFGENKRYAIFPAVSAAWRISDESFWNKTETVNDVKLRASIGKTGNQTIGDFTAQGQYATGASYIGQSGIFLSTIPNPDLTWETTLQYNGGLDISLFKSRISLSIDAYVKNTSNLLLNVPLPNTSGFGSVLQNVGSTQNRGLEFTLNTINIENKDITWSSNFNISFNKNKVTQLYSGTSNILVGSGQGLTGSLASYSILQVGSPIGSFFGWKESGVYKNAADNTTNVSNTSLGTNGYIFKGGDMIFLDVNKNNTIGNDDRMIIGNAQPKFTGGFSNTFKYKNFDLSALFTFSYGNDMVNGTRYAAESATGFTASQTLLRRWKNEGDITDIPRASYIDPGGNRRFSNRWLEDGSYLRLKDITLRYQLPKTLMSKISVKSCRIYATAQNLITLTKYTGYDPEASSFNSNVTQIGIDQGTYPQYRAFIFGLTVGF